MKFKSKTSLNIGMITIGHSVYWSQMPGVKEEIESNIATIEERLSLYGSVINAGLVDNIEKARKTDELFLSSLIDVIILNVGTYGPSKYLVQCIRKCCVPLITLHLQPVKSFPINSQSKDTIPKNVFSAAGEYGAILRRLGIPYYSIVGQLYNDDRPWTELGEWFRAIKIKKQVSQLTIAQIGNFYPGMCDLYVDHLQLMKMFGIDIELLTIADLREEFNKVSAEEVKVIKKSVRDTFLLDSNIPEKELDENVKIAVAMNNLVTTHNLNGIGIHAVGYPGSPEDRIGYSIILGASLLTAKGIPVTVEGDIVTAIGMKILMLLGGGASQTEFNVANFADNTIYISHGGPADISLANKKPVLKWLDFFHGRSGSGLCCTFSIKKGPITLFSLSQDASGDIVSFVMEGEIVSEEYLANGNVNSKAKFPQRRISDFMENVIESGPTHHYAVTTGHPCRYFEKGDHTHGNETSSTVTIIYICL